MALEVKRRNSNNDLLQGPAESCGASSGIILGVNFDLVDGTTTYEDENENDITNANPFCNAVNPGSAFVRVRDDQGSGDGIADEAELED